MLSLGSGLLDMQNAVTNTDPRSGHGGRSAVSVAGLQPAPRAPRNTRTPRTSRNRFPSLWKRQHRGGLCGLGNVGGVGYVSRLGHKRSRYFRGLGNLIAME